ncbi:MAG: hypothetical protein IT238_11170 [Bacteroidia bacterium]|nr:hypothetical protein [Bacteroidia bacterium]
MPVTPLVFVVKCLKDKLLCKSSKPSTIYNVETNFTQHVVSTTYETDCCGFNVIDAVALQKKKLHIGVGVYWS